jgi:hypothetical protein
METWRYGNMETLRDGGMETLRDGGMETLRDGGMETWKQLDMDKEHGDIKRKTEAQAIFFDPFTVCSLCKWKFVVCPLADEDTI